MQEPINYYNFPLVDTSQLAMMDLSTKLQTYKVDVSQMTELSNFNNDNSFFDAVIV